MANFTPVNSVTFVLWMSIRYSLGTTHAWEFPAPNWDICRLPCDGAAENGWLWRRAQPAKQIMELQRMRASRVSLSVLKLSLEGVTDMTSRH